MSAYGRRMLLLSLPESRQSIRRSKMDEIAVRMGTDYAHIDLPPCIVKKIYGKVGVAEAQVHLAAAVGGGHTSRRGVRVGYAACDARRGSRAHKAALPQHAAALGQPARPAARGCRGQVCMAPSTR